MRCSECGYEIGDKQDVCPYCGAPVKKGKGRLILILVIVLAVVSLTAAGSVYFVKKHTKNKYDEMISQGAKYYASMNYDPAVTIYQEAIELLPEKEEGYAGLARAYMAKGDYDNAKDTLLKGISVTNAVALIHQLGDAMGAVKSEETVEELDEEQLFALSQEVEIQDLVLTAAASYTYRDYIQNYGLPQIIPDDQGKLYVSFAEFGGQCVFYDLADDSYIVDEASGQPFENRKPNEVIFASANDLFVNFQGAVSSERLNEILGMAEISGWNEEAGRYESVFFCKKCVLTIETDENGNIVSPNGYIAIRPMTASELSEEDEKEPACTFEGKIVNAVTGQGMRASVRVRQEGKKTGQVWETVETNADGSYTIALSEGKYMLEVSASGFITDYFEIAVKENTKNSGDFVLSPELAQGEVRIVLEWGDRPYDLDSYLSGTLDDGTNISVNFKNRSQNDGNGNVAANLDVDKRDGRGPETITIKNLNGEFHYVVHDFQHEGTTGSSGATVKVYMPGESAPTVIQVPSSVENMWDVLWIEDGNLRIVNSGAADQCRAGSK